MLGVYVRDILMKKRGGDVIELYQLASFGTMLKSLTQGDFGDVILPVLEKLLKKNPDSVLVVVTSLVKHINVDLSTHVGTFFPPLLRQLRSTNDQVRLLAVELVGNLADRCGETKVIP